MGHHSLAADRLHDQGLVHVRSMNGATLLLRPTTLAPYPNLAHLYVPPVHSKSAYAQAQTSNARSVTNTCMIRASPPQSIASCHGFFTPAACMAASAEPPQILRACCIHLLPAQTGQTHRHRDIDTHTVPHISHRHFKSLLNPCTSAGCSVYRIRRCTHGRASAKGPARLHLQSEHNFTHTEMHTDYTSATVASTPYALHDHGLGYVHCRHEATAAVCSAKPLPRPQAHMLHAHPSPSYRPITAHQLWPTC